MASLNIPPLLHLSLFFFLLQPFYSMANLHNRSTTLLTSNLVEQINHRLGDEVPPTVYFEITKPIKVPNIQPCSHRIFRHKLGHTLDQPPVNVDYNPPSGCPSQDFSKIVLEWTATCKGIQVGRIVGVWLSGVELLRTCTAEPIPTGIVWTVYKDITRYYHLLMKQETQKFVVFLDNTVDEASTGVYDVTITIHFYPADEDEISKRNSNYNMDNRADLILPVSRKMQLNDGLWFRIESEDGPRSKKIKIPQNAYKAVLEVYVSFHDKDEFWYRNLHDDYIAANGVTDKPGHGSFREVLVSVDKKLVGGIWPFTVIYTGGINPFLWRPISGIGSFDLPSYDIDITPFLGTMLDGEKHKLSFGVAKALNVWYIDANLHLWLDHNNVKTEGGLLNHEHPSIDYSYKPYFHGRSGKSVTTAKWSISSSGWVESSYGNITSHFSQEFDYTNTMTIADDENKLTVDQKIVVNQKANEETPSSNTLSMESVNKYMISINNHDVINQAVLNTYLRRSEVSLLHEQESLKDEDTKRAQSFLHNYQLARGTVVVNDNNVVVDGLGNTKQEYVSTGFDGVCYTRKMESFNYSVSDVVGYNCNENT